MEGRVVLITGGSRPGQLGEALAEAFLEAGARVALAGRRAAGEESGPALAEAVASGALSLHEAELADAAAAERLVAEVLASHGRLDALVQAAGGLRVLKPLGETAPEEWDGELERNARTAFVMGRAALPALRESGGSMVNFASPAALGSGAGLGAYAAGKAAVVALTRALAAEERGRVRVNAVAPGMVDTAQNLAAVADPAAVRWVRREEVARVVVFLAGPASSGVTGQVIEVADGTAR
jgi:NAD(P)-dependent dehydrogenase (short-subunit alcohol dehydrogenase family)